MKRTRIYTALVALLAVLNLSSCREDYPEVLVPDQENLFIDWSHVFESFWNGMNYSYAFWAIDPTDWDQVYTDYKPQFEGLAFENSADSLKAKELFRQIVTPLVDHHYKFILKGADGNPFLEVRPGLEEAQTRDYYHPLLDQQQMLQNVMLLRDQGRATELKGSLGDFTLYTCLIDDCIVYVRFNSFNIGNAMALDPYVALIVEQYYKLINETPNLKGVIIDTRSNGGGSLVDIDIILTPFLSEEVHFGYTRTKNGMGRLDYTPWIPQILKPLKENPVTRNMEDVTIVSLLDLHSVSMAEMTPMAVDELPNGVLIGERSFGGHGPLNNDISSFYTGTLENSAFLMMTSTSMGKRIDGRCYEGIGVIPDIEVLYDEAEFNRGNDTQLERAIAYIKTNQ